MLCVRFHGRGGHGVKTASRILGTAAFLGGMVAQDSPVYGAERRGAAITAFTRIDDELILERGVITQPDLVLIADETLLADPTARVLAGADTASAVFVNSCVDSQLLASRYEIACPVVSHDLTGIAADVIGRSSALSSVLGAVSCKLSGVVPEDRMIRAVREELESLGLGQDAMDRNVEAARRAYTSVDSVAIRPRSASPRAAVMVQPALVAPELGTATVYAPGNSGARHTGSWRIFRPVIQLDDCTRCLICLVRCPDAAISLDRNGYPVIDYENCKGCMICYEECPPKCIHEEKEVRAW
jgi:pyruvate ferredoxin oxidoreductase gamma subunit